MKICALTHPIPTIYAERIYNDNKTVFVGKRYLGKVSQGDKFIIYESQGAKAYTGWANIKFMGRMGINEILKKYKNNLMLEEKEFKEYSKGKIEMTVIEFEDIQRFNNPVVPKRFVSVGGKYIYEEEYERILNNKD